MDRAKFPSSCDSHDPDWSRWEAEKHVALTGRAQAALRLTSRFDAFIVSLGTGKQSVGTTQKAIAEQAQPLMYRVIESSEVAHDCWCEI